MSVPNPFIIGQPIDPERYIGHEETLRLTLDRLGHETRASTSVIGAGYSGRTSFLRYLVHDTARKRHPELKPYWPILYEALLDEDLHPPGFWLEIFELATQVCQGEAVLEALQRGISKAEEGRIGMPLLKLIVDSIGRTGHTLLLAIDDFDNLMKHPNFTPPKERQFFERLRSLCQRPTHGMAIVMTTLRPLKDLWQYPHGSIFYNIFANAPLGRLTDDEVELLLQGYLADAEIQFSAGDIAEIRERSSNLPVYVQYYAQLMFDAHRAGLNDEARRREAIQKALQKPDNNHTLMVRFQQDRMKATERNAFTKAVRNPESLTQEDKRLLMVLDSRGGLPPGVRIL